MVFSEYKKQCVLALASRGLKAPTIAKELQKENLKCLRVGVHKLLCKFEEMGSISRRVGSGRPSKVTTEIKQIAEEQMRIGDKMTAYQLHHLLSENGYSISLCMILRCRTMLGWTFRGSAYCQLIHDLGKRTTYFRGLRVNLHMTMVSAVAMPFLAIDREDRSVTHVVPR